MSKSKGQGGSAAAEQTINMPIVYRSMEVRAGSYNAETRTFEAVAATDAKVLRYDWNIGWYYEELGMEAQHIRMERFGGGNAPLLNAHNTYDLDAVIGVVEKGWLEGRKLMAGPRMSGHPSVEPYEFRIKEGVLKNVSVGYQVHRLELVSQGDEEIPTYRATDWEPFELSVVPVPADAGATIRSDTENKTNRCTIIGARALNESKKPMSKRNGGDQPGADTTAPENENKGTQTDANTGGEGGQGEGQENAGEARASGARTERVRVLEITMFGQRHKLDAEFTAKLVKDGTPIEQARKLILDKLAEGTEQHDVRGVNATVVREKRDGMGEAMKAAIMLRAHGGNAAKFMKDVKDETVKRAKDEYRGMRLMDLAREYLTEEGFKLRGMTQMDIATLALGGRVRGMHTTSDFPYLLADVSNQTLRAAYAQVPQTFAPFVRRTVASDFKPISSVQISGAPALQKVKENGEFTRGTIGEGKEMYRVETYGKIIAITRQVLINDSLDAFARVPMLMGRKAADLESDLVYGLLLSNPTMLTDNKAVFHTAHKNLNTGTASALSAADVASLDKTRANLRLQKDIDGKNRLNLSLTHILVPVALEGKADKLTARISAALADNVNVYAGTLQPIVEPRLDDVSETAWYGVAGNGQVDGIELATLEGEEGPHFETRVGFDVDGIELKERHDVGGGFVDYRGFQLNTGVNP